MKGLTKPVQYLLGALTPYGVVTFVENCVYEPVLLIRNKDNITCMVQRRDLRGLRVLPREVRTPIKPHEAQSWWGPLAGYALATPEDAQDWLEPIMAGAA
jgi:hypothetical protein